MINVSGFVIGEQNKRMRSSCVKVYKTYGIGNLLLKVEKLYIAIRSNTPSYFFTRIPDLDQNSCCKL